MKEEKNDKIQANIMLEVLFNSQSKDKSKSIRLISKQLSDTDDWFKKIVDYTYNILQNEQIINENSYDAAKEIKLKTEYFDFLLECYKIPNELKILENAVSKQFDSKSKHTEFYWSFKNEDLECKYEKIVQSKIAEKYLLNKDYVTKQLSKQTNDTPLFAFRYIDKPLIIYGMECILTFHVLIDRAKPLSINVYNNCVVSMIEGPYFVKEK